MIFLVGYRAVGKSTIGRLLAQELLMDFIDLDDWICDNARKTVSEIVDSEGWTGFRKRENDALIEASFMVDTVVATGGGAVLHEEIWPELKGCGFVVWLNARVETLCDRLTVADNGHRPSLTGGGLLKEIETVFAARLPLYKEIADLTVQTDDMSIGDAILEISTEFKGFSCRKVKQKLGA